MKKISFLILFTVAVSATFTSCKKEKAEPKEDLTAKVSTQADDNARVNKELDDMHNDVNNSVSAAPSMSGGRMDEVLPCDATVLYDTLGLNRQLTITYNGTSCDGLRTRTGVITVSIPLGVQWNDAGAVLTVDIQNLHVTRLSDDKSITLNGTQTVTNTTGGLVPFLAGLGNIKHRIHGTDLHITFDDNTQRMWSVDKQHEFTYDNGIKFSVIGLHTEGLTTGILEWGTSRDGSTFQTIINEPLVLRQDCNFRLTSGKETIKNITSGITLVITAGLDAQGNAADCPGMFNPYYMKIVWTDAEGNSYNVLKPYW